MKPYVFKYDEFCVFAGYQRSNKEGQWSKTIMKD